MTKVLIVDDDRATLEVLTRAVESLGYHSIRAHNGERARTILEDNRDLDLVITDVMMPELSGPQLIDAARAMKHHKETPFLVISGVIGPNAISGALEAGASEFLPKPLAINELQEAIKRYTEKQPAEA